jgi:membrane fusion protein (multidrug efflux system)
MREGGAASAANLDGASARLEGAESRLRGADAALGVARRALADAEVRAPYAGVIARRTVSRGEYVTPGQPLFELVSVNPLEVEFHLAERDSSQVAIDREVEVRVASHPEQVFRGKVHMISPTIDARTRTLRVKATVDNSGGELRPGLFARVELGVRERDGVLMIPEEAVMQRASGPEVFVLALDERAERREVQTGTHRDGRVEVRRGLSAGEWVITQGTLSLVNGMKVEAQLRDGSPWPGSLARRESDGIPHP